MAKSFPVFKEKIYVVKCVKKCKILGTSKKQCWHLFSAEITSKHSPSYKNKMLVMNCIKEIISKLY